ncbi:MAG: hypothetical protein R3D60_09850 [Paracoccaceae bacterium]
MNWIRSNAPVIEAIAAALTALVAVAALAGVKVQLDRTDALQRAQSARDAFRAHLALSVEHPAFTDPTDACALLTSDRAAAYGAFVEHLLYSAEQMLAIDEGWEPTFTALLPPHAAYLCATDDLSTYTPPLDGILLRFQAGACPATPACGT